VRCVAGAALNESPNFILAESVEASSSPGELLRRSRGDGFNNREQALIAPTMGLSWLVVQV